MFAPLFLKLGLQDLRSSLPGEPSLLQAQLAHVHVVLPGHQEYRSPAGVELHLPGNPEPVKVSVPPAFLCLLGGTCNGIGYTVTIFTGCT